MLSASSITMFQPKHDPLVAVTLSLPLSSRLLRLSQRKAARGRFTKHRARVCRYRYHDHLTHSGRPKVFGEVGSQLGKTAAPHPPSAAGPDEPHRISQQEILHLVYSTLQGRLNADQTTSYIAP